MYFIDKYIDKLDLHSEKQFFGGSKTKFSLRVSFPPVIRRYSEERGEFNVYKSEVELR